MAGASTVDIVLQLNVSSRRLGDKTTDTNESEAVQGQKLEATGKMKAEEDL